MTAYKTFMHKFLSAQEYKTLESDVPCYKEFTADGSKWVVELNQSNDECSYDHKLCFNYELNYDVPSINEPVWGGGSYEYLSDTVERLICNGKTVRQFDENKISQMTRSLSYSTITLFDEFVAKPVTESGVGIWSIELSNSIVAFWTQLMDMFEETATTYTILGVNNDMTKFLTVRFNTLNSAIDKKRDFGLVLQKYLKDQSYLKSKTYIKLKVTHPVMSDSLAKKVSDEFITAIIINPKAMKDFDSWDRFYVYRLSAKYLSVLGMHEIIPILIMRRINSVTDRGHHISVFKDVYRKAFGVIHDDSFSGNAYIRILNTMYIYLNKKDLTDIINLNRFADASIEFKNWLTAIELFGYITFYKFSAKGLANYKKWSSTSPALNYSRDDIAWNVRHIVQNVEIDDGVYVNSVPGRVVNELFNHDADSMTLGRVQFYDDTRTKGYIKFFTNFGLSTNFDSHIGLGDSGVLVSDGSVVGRPNLKLTPMFGGRIKIKVTVNLTDVINSNGYVFEKPSIGLKYNARKYKNNHLPGPGPGFPFIHRHFAHGTGVMINGNASKVVLKFKAETSFLYRVYFKSILDSYNEICSVSVTTNGETITTDIMPTQNKIGQAYIPLSNNDIALSGHRFSKGDPVDVNINYTKVNVIDAKIFYIVVVAESLVQYNNGKLEYIKTPVS